LDHSRLTGATSVKLPVPRANLPKEIMDLFKKLNAQEITIVQITHSEKNAADGNHFIQLRDGWIFELRNLNH
jgi:ABC-type lipoprotein export system ATPase subunit